MLRLYLCLKIVFNSETNDWVLPTLILLLLQPNWKHGESFTNILLCKSRRVRPTSSSRSSFQLRYISRTISTAYGAIKFKKKQVIQTSSLILFVHFAAMRHQQSMLQLQVISYRLLLDL